MLIRWSFTENRVSSIIPETDQIRILNSVYTEVEFVTTMTVRLSGRLDRVPLKYHILIKKILSCYYNVTACRYSGKSWRWLVIF